ncbi:hypothetical protein [Rhodococcus sp. BS-15]|uniref:hypothetical protein n=1 Tax=Rhodococcus sp. BS-15 TaxID=1304954 RepID=UPI000FFC59AC|nr:hypothetical protein [Rhodococcus sp. BS-15]
MVSDERVVDGTAADRGSLEGAGAGGDHTVGGAVSSGVGSEPLTSVVGTLIDSVGTGVNSGVTSAVGSGVGLGTISVVSLGSEGSIGSEGRTGIVVTDVGGSIGIAVVTSGDEGFDVGSIGHSIGGRSGAGRSVGVLVGGAVVVDRDDDPVASTEVAVGSDRSPGVLPVVGGFSSGDQPR